MATSLSLKPRICAKNQMVRVYGRKKLRLAIEPEAALGRSRIVDQFDPAFFKTDFWLMWCTTFAFQPWHSAVEFKRYLVRFAHMVDGFSRLQGIMRTTYNQYDSLIRPLRKWLDDLGVVFSINTRVTDLRIQDRDGVKTVEQIVYRRGGQGGDIVVRPVDRVLVTLGSMTESSSLGSMDTAPLIKGKAEGGSWALWEAIAVRNLAIPLRLPTRSTSRSGFPSP
jgi:oleate hydratase